MPTPTPHTQNDRPDVKTWVLVLGALFFVNVIAPALSALAGLVIR